MKTKRTKKQTTPIWKVGCAQLASCILLSSCGQNAQNAQSLPQELTQDAQKPTAIPEATESSALTSTPEPTPEPTPSSTPTPEPTPTNTPILMPTFTPEPTPMPDFTFLPQMYPFDPEKTSLPDYMTQEEIDTAFSLSYDPFYEQMQLYGRYQGSLKVFRDIYSYCIDLIKMSNTASSDFLINIKIYNGSITYFKDGESSLLQNMYYYVDFGTTLDAVTEVLRIMDLNGDGYDDFIFNLGIVGNKNKYSLAFVYDVETDSYVLLGEFYTATYMPEYQTICEESYGSMGDPSHVYKYFVDGTQAILTEVIDYLSGERESCTYKKLVDGELVTLLEDGTYKELCEFIGNFETWEKMPATLE